MSGRYFLRLSSLIGLLSLTTCKPKDIGPSIDDVVGQYDATLEFTGDAQRTEFPTKGILVTKSTAKENVLDLQVVVDNLLIERWEIQYLAGGELVMDRQEVWVEPTVYGYTNRESKKGLGRVSGDSLLLEGRRFFEPNILWGSAFFKCRAKKRH